MSTFSPEASPGSVASRLPVISNVGYKTPSLGRAMLGRMRNLIALNVQLSGVVPEWVELIPAGPVVQGRDGRKWRFGATDMQHVIDRHIAAGVDIPIDYEHATELRGTKGEEAPAAAWIKELQDRAGALWGRVEWTDKARAYVEARAYRYLSPVFVFDKESGSIREILSAGLTNQPNLRLTALNRQQAETMEGESMRKALCKLLGLDPDKATEQEIQDAVAKTKSDLATAANRAMPVELLTILGLTAGDDSQAVAKVKELFEQAKASNRQDPPKAPDLTAYVPRADYDLALNRAVKAEDAVKQRAAADLDTKIEAAVNAAIKDGKIAPSSKDYYVATCRTEGGLQQFEKFAATAPQVIKDPQLPDEPKSGKHNLTDTERAVCRNLGIAEEDYVKNIQDKEE